MDPIEGRERICHLERGPKGFGFVLCCENDTTDTFVLHVLDNSPASKTGLRTGDRIIEINAMNVESESHTDVVKMLQGLKHLRLVVAFNKTASQYFAKPANGMTVRPLEPKSEIHKPKFITIHRGITGYDFVVKTVGKSHTVGTGKYRQNLKGITGHFADSVDTNGNAYAAGLRPGHRIIKINNINVEKESHAYVIAAIKTSPNRIVQLVVIDSETDDFHKNNGSSPASSIHAKGEFNFRDVIDKSNYDISDNDVTPPVSPISSSRVSTEIEEPIPSHLSLESLESLTKKTEELIRELKIHNDQIRDYKSNISHSKSCVDPTLRNKYLNLRDASSNPGTPRFPRNHDQRSTTSSSDDDASRASNNNSSFLCESPPPAYKPATDLSVLEYNVDLQTLKEYVRNKVGRNKSVYRDKVGYGNYALAHRAVNNI